MPGPAPKPLALRVLHGDPKKSRTDLVEPEASPLTDATPPPYMNPAAREVWTDVVTELDAMGIIRQCDTYVVEAFVSAYRTFITASDDVERHGSLVPGQKGNLVRNPACAIQRDAMNLLRLLARELGMSPAARTAMATRPEADGTDNLAARYLTGS